MDIQQAFALVFCSWCFERRVFLHFDTDITEINWKIIINFNSNGNSKILITVTVTEKKIMTNLNRTAVTARRR